MNKQKFVDFLRSPHHISDKDLEEIQHTISEFPYFQSARTILAKASKIKSLPSAKTEITRASIYATDRSHLKKYIVGDLIFLRPLNVHDSHEGEKNRLENKLVALNIANETSPTAEEKHIEQPDHKTSGQEPQIVETTTNANSASEREVEKVPAVKEEDKTSEDSPVDHKKEFITEKEVTQENQQISQPNFENGENSNELVIPDNPESDLDHLIENIFADIKDLQMNRAKLVALEKKIEEEDAVNDAVEKATKKAQEKGTITESINPKEDEISKTTEEKKTKVENSLTEVNLSEDNLTDHSENTDNDESAKETNSTTTVEEEESGNAKDEIIGSTPVEPEADTSDAETQKPSPRKPKAKRRLSKKTPVKKVDTKTTISSKKVIKGESAIEKAAAKMRASGKIKENQGPEIKKGESKVNNTPPEKIIKTYIRKRSSERTSESESKANSEEKGGDKDDKPGPAVQGEPNDIIESFIKNQPSISPKKDSLEISLGDLSIRSTEFNPEVASEYLAEIFLEQNMTNKAISIYEQLILTFPDKSTYFAAIIKKLKD
ncbi:MAG: hypothetical protein ACI93L_003022 [Cyclobacteriaceae bacterium]